MKKCFWKKGGQVITPAASHFFVSRGGTRGSIRAAPSANNSWSHCWLCVTRLFFPSVWYTVFPELLQSELALWVIAHTVVNLHCRQHFWGVLIWSGEAASASLHQVSYGILIFGGFSFIRAVPRAVQDSLRTGKREGSWAERPWGRARVPAAYDNHRLRVYSLLSAASLLFSQSFPLTYICHFLGLLLPAFQTFPLFEHTRVSSGDQSHPHSAAGTTNAAASRDAFPSAHCASFTLSVVNTLHPRWEMPFAPCLLLGRIRERGVWSKMTRAIE